MIQRFLYGLKNIPQFDESLDISPYAKMMGFRLMGQDGSLTTVMKYNTDLIGSPFPPALHGGTVASLLEMAAILQLAWNLDLHENDKFVPKAIDITIDYLKSGKPEDTYAQARIFRQGRRFATLHAEAWQSDPNRFIASAMLHFQLVE